MRYSIREPGGVTYAEADGFKEALALLHKAKYSGWPKARIYYRVGGME